MTARAARRILGALLLGVSLAGCQREGPAPTAGPTAVITPAAGQATRAAATATATPAAAERPATSDTPTPFPAPALTFSGESALEFAAAQLALGPRWPGSQGHQEVGDLIIAEALALGWAVIEQPLSYRGVTGRNIIAVANEGVGPVIILGAHYDTRRVADQTAGAVADGVPVPGAVDGASGVGVLLELARTLDLATISNEIWLAFFDFEDNGGEGLPGWDWIVGSSFMADNLSQTPAAMVLIDMVGQLDQEIYFEGNSDLALRETIWSQAAELGYSEDFIPILRYTMIDDHVPFKELGIPSVDLIDFDYPYWHTVEDTLDKLSAVSLERVGLTLEVWLETTP